LPRIPQYEQQTTPGAQLVVRNPSTGSNDIARGLAVVTGGARQMGRSLKYVEEVQQRKLEADAKAETHGKLSEFEAQQITGLTERKLAAEGDPAGFTDQLLKDFDEQAGKIVGEARTPDAKQYAQEQLTQLRARLHSSALPWEAEKGIRHRAGQYERSIDSQRIIVRANPEQFDEVLERQGAALNALSLPADVRDELWANTKEAVAASAVESLIDRNPSRALKALRQAP
jgi:hypothetical protein